MPVNPEGPDADRTEIGTAVGMGASLPHTTLPPSRQTDVVGIRQVGRYEVLEPLGKGAMASVYKAFDPGINRTLAVKFLHADLSLDAEHRERFLREARAAGGLAHPNIVTVYDVGEIKDRPYIAMELLEGRTLADAVRESHTLPVRQVAQIGAQLAQALDYAHARGVFHRDIKPSNVMLLRDGVTVKVADFGIAHMESTVAGAETQVGTLVGTPQYMSPEQARGDKVDGRSDLFSVGVVLYQLLAGQLPFRATRFLALAQQITTEKPVPVEQLRPEVPAALRRVVERCLQKLPAKRFQTGRELADALSRVLRDLDEAAAAAGKPRLIPLRVKWALTMGLVIALTMTGTAMLVVQRQHAAMIGQVMDYGASLAKFLAVENAESALLKEWVAIDVSVKDIMATQSFQGITVLDREGIAQVSSVPARVGQRLQMPPGSQVLAKRADGVVVSRHFADDGASVLLFEAPITFRRDAGRVEVGRVHLGVYEEPLARVEKISIVSLIVLVAVTVLAVMIAAFLMANRYFKQIRTLVDSLGEFGGGHLDYRIREPRRDEFGEVFRAFDDMADAIQQRIEPVAAETGETQKAAGDDGVR